MSSSDRPFAMFGHRRPLLSPSLQDPRFIRGDRYAIYQRMRAQSPVYWDRALTCWVVTGYAEAMAALKEPRLAADRMASVYDVIPIEERARFAPLIESVSRFLLFRDAPQHTRIRALVHKAFTPRRVEGMRAHMQEVVDRLIDDVAPRGEMDAMADFAYRLPTTVIAEMLGIPSEDHELFRHWTEGLAVFLGDMIHSAQALETGLESIQGMTDYFRQALRRVRAHPGPDLLTALAQAEEQGDVLTEDELLSTAILLLAAGHETTATSVGTGLWLLLTHPDQRALVDEDPERMTAAVEEIVRYESPIQLTGREAREALTLGGANILPGQLVVISLGGANRDPAQFPEPDTFDITRPENKHLAFSHGPHYCVGAMLARAETQVALTTLLKRFPDIALVDEQADWKPNQVFRGLNTLRVTL
ncbi:MAG: cytochrome P450 [Myxococcota bacterium]